MRFFLMTVSRCIARVTYLLPRGLDGQIEGGPAQKRESSCAPRACSIDLQKTRNRSPIPPLPPGKGGVRVREKQGERLRVRSCPTLKCKPLYSLSYAAGRTNCSRWPVVGGNDVGVSPRRVALHAAVISFRTLRCCCLRDATTVIIASTKRGLSGFACWSCLCASVPFTFPTT